MNLVNLTLLIHLQFNTNEEFKVERLTFRMGNWYDYFTQRGWRTDCKFTAEGKKISGCQYIKDIKVIKGKQNDEFGYHKTMWVKITVDSKYLKPGSYYTRQFILIKTDSASKWFKGKEALAPR